MKNYDPNIRLGTHTIKVSFQRWDYKGFVTFRRGGNCKGLDVLALNEDDLYDQTCCDKRSCTRTYSKSSHRLQTSKCGIYYTNKNKCDKRN